MIKPSRPNRAHSSHFESEQGEQIKLRTSMNMQLSEVIFAFAAARLSFDGGTKGVEFAGSASVEEKAGGAGVRDDDDDHDDHDHDDDHSHDHDDDHDDHDGA